jgi:hypothetical protein
MEREALVRRRWAETSVRKHDVPTQQNRDATRNLIAPSISAPERPPSGGLFFCPVAASLPSQLFTTTRHIQCGLRITSTL